jgi:NADPH2:quinone reductase
VKGLGAGDKVVTVHPFGSHAELRAVPARNAWRIPAGADVRQAAAVPIPFGTADDCLFEFGRLRAGETVLVQAGASGVGIAAIQLAKRAGATVIATASSEAKLARLIAFGMDHGIDYRTQDLVAEAKRRRARREPRRRSSRHHARRACVPRLPRARLARRPRRPRRDEAHASVLMAGNQSLTGVFLGAEIVTDRAHDMIQRHVDDVAKGALRVAIDSTFPLREAAAAHRHIESRQAFGRVLLIP